MNWDGFLVCHKCLFAFNIDVMITYDSKWSQIWTNEMYCEHLSVWRYCLHKQMSMLVWRAFILHPTNCRKHETYSTKNKWSFIQVYCLRLSSFSSTTISSIIIQKSRNWNITCGMKKTNYWWNFIRLCLNLTVQRSKRCGWVW